jgi:hypothetical protein
MTNWFILYSRRRVYVHSIWYFIRKLCFQWKLHWFGWMAIILRGRYTEKDTWYHQKILFNKYCRFDHGMTGISCQLDLVGVIAITFTPKHDIQKLNSNLAWITNIRLPTFRNIPQRKLCSLVNYLINNELWPTTYLKCKITILSLNIFIQQTTFNFMIYSLQMVNDLFIAILQHWWNCIVLNWNISQLLKRVHGKYLQLLSIIELVSVYFIHLKVLSKLDNWWFSIQK